MSGLLSSMVPGEWRPVTADFSNVASQGAIAEKYFSNLGNVVNQINQDRIKEDQFRREEMLKQYELDEKSRQFGIQEDRLNRQLAQEDALERMKDTTERWKTTQKGNYDLALEAARGRNQLAQLDRTLANQIKLKENERAYEEQQRKEIAAALTQAYDYALGRELTNKTNQMTNEITQTTTGDVNKINNLKNVKTVLDNKLKRIDAEIAKMPKLSENASNKQLSDAEYSKQGFLITDKNGNILPLYPKKEGGVTGQWVDNATDDLRNWFTAREQGFADLKQNGVTADDIPDMFVHTLESVPKLLYYGLERGLLNGAFSRSRNYQYGNDPELLHRYNQLTAQKQQLQKTRDDYLKQIKDAEKVRNQTELSIRDKWQSELEKSNPLPKTADGKTQTGPIAQYQAYIRKMAELGRPVTKTENLDDPLNLATNSIFNAFTANAKSTAETTNDILQHRDKKITDIWYQQQQDSKSLADLAEGSKHKILTDTDKIAYNQLGTDILQWAQNNNLRITKADLNNALQDAVLDTNYENGAIGRFWTKKVEGYDLNSSKVEQLRQELQSLKNVSLNATTLENIKNQISPELYRLLQTLILKTDINTRNFRAFMSK